MKKILIGIGVAIAVVLLAIFSINGVKNTAISYEEEISESRSNITVQEKRRADLIPNLVDCVKDYNRHEYETLMAVIEARKSEGASDDSISTEVQNMINVVAEAYPELKSNTNYNTLMLELATTENLISQHRMNYNRLIKSYKTYVRQFPNSLFLPLCGYVSQQYEPIVFEDVVDAPTNLFD